MLPPVMAHRFPRRCHPPRLLLERLELLPVQRLVLVLDVRPLRFLPRDSLLAVALRLAEVPPPPALVLAPRVRPNARVIPRGQPLEHARRPGRVVHRPRPDDLAQVVLDVVCHAAPQADAARALRHDARRRPSSARDGRGRTEELMNQFCWRRCTAARS
eukprot:30017-Pelagococcus_subviridis.AAC.7